MSDATGSRVASFYSGKSVFVTGGTGFLGKTLIEKLLYSCSGIDKIYVLVRDKYGKQAGERLARITSTPVFDRLKACRNEDLKKITAIPGDITRENLGLSDDILKCLEEEVSVVFHLAATVAFKLPLKDAMRVNINGTDHVIALCHRMKKLQAFIHVSTAFSNSDRKEINEEVYPMPIELEDARYIAEMYSYDDRVISEFMGKKPNTYTFSKAFAEEQVMKQSEDLPVSIVRPSIVISSVKEPCPGWIDSWNGSTGLFVGMPAGVLKVVKGRGTNVTDLVPVDIVTNLVIVAATECRKSKQIKVYNCCTGTSNPITCDGATAIARKVTFKYSLSFSNKIVGELVYETVSNIKSKDEEIFNLTVPFPCNKTGVVSWRQHKDELPWPFLLFTPSVLLYSLITFLLQIIPAYFIDLWCVLTGKKATQVKLQKRLKKVIEAVKFFLLNEWKFSDDNVRNLYKTLSPQDKETFNFDVSTINWETCIEDYVLGIRKYLLKPEKQILE